MAVSIVVHAHNTATTNEHNIPSGGAWWTVADAIRLNQDGSINEISFASTQKNPFSTTANFTNPTAFDADGTGEARVQFHVWVVGPNNILYRYASNGGPDLPVPYPSS